MLKSRLRHLPIAIAIFHLQIRSSPVSLAASLDCLQDLVKILVTTQPIRTFMNRGLTEHEKIIEKLAM